MDLIRDDVQRKDWKAVLQGVKYQVEAFTELYNDLESLRQKGVLRGC